MAVRFDFDKLWKAYPTGDSKSVKKLIGGAVNADWITNTCAVRLSRCLNTDPNLKLPVTMNFPDKRWPEKLTTVKGGDGMRFCFRVAEMLKYLQVKLGNPQIKLNKKRGDAMPPEFKGKKGIIVFYDCGWSDATGHIDLWNGETCAGNKYFEPAKQLYLWTPDARWQVTAALGGQVADGNTPVISIARG